MAGRRKFAWGFFFPLLIVIGVTLVALFTLFGLMVTQQNDLSQLREQAQLESAIHAKMGFLSNNLRDYAMWTESVEHLAIKLDFDWANEVIGPYLFRTKGYEYTFVLDDAGRTIYASHRTAQSRVTADQVMGPSFHSAIGQLLRAPDGREERLTMLVEIGGQPAIVAASTVLPDIGSSYSKALPRRYLVIVQPMGRDFLAELSRGYRLADLDLRKTPPRESDTRIALRGFDGAPVGYLHWKSARPGDRMFSSYLPWLLLIAAQALILSIYITRRASRLTSDLEASEVTAWHLANHDTLTALPNRRALRECGMRQPADEPMAMLYLDLDGFKEVNDLFGHQAGDVLLMEAAERLRAIVGEKAILARVGGDEFAILITSGPVRELASEMAGTIVDSMAQPFESNQIRMVVSASIGIALGEPGQDIDDLSRYADIAMYAAKADGKNRWRIYHSRMDEGREMRKLLESELRDAVEVGDIGVMFQPIVDAREGQVAAVEALARWNSPTQGPVGPAIFIPIAEESGLIAKLGELVLRKACAAARDWDVTLTVNVSPAQFWHRSLVEDVLAILAEYRFPPERLELEITEGYLLTRPEKAAKVIQQIRSHGIKVALDDFGTGFASIGYLRRFELDRLKLDRSLVDAVHQSRESANVARAVIGLSQALALPITAEGVEHEPQALFLSLAGCERLQGWRFGAAAPAADIEARLIAGPDEDRQQSAQS